MPLQVFGTPPMKKKSFGQHFAEGVNSAMQGGAAAYQQIKKLEAQKQEDAYVSKLLGFDVQGMSPDLKKIVIQEKMREEAKEAQIQKKMDLYNKVFGGNGMAGRQPGRGEGQGGFGQKHPQGFPSEQPGMEDDFSEQPEMQDQMQNGPREIFSAEEIAFGTALDRDLGRAMRESTDSALKQQRHKEDIQERRDMIREQREHEIKKMQRKEHTKISDPILLELNQVRKNIPLQEQAIQDITEASSDVGWRDYLAELSGIEPLRSAEGVKLKTAIKEFFLSDLTRAGARPNQWIEQQLADALPKIGRSPEANLINAEGMKFKVDLAKKRLEIIDELALADREKYGYVRGDIDSRAYKLLAPYAKMRQKELYDNIKAIKFAEKGIKSKKQDESGNEKEYIRMKSPTGEMFDIQAGDVDEALEAGYDFQ